MAKIEDILATERDRKDAALLNKVHLYKTGAFYSAYDWSAWLISVVSYNDEVRMKTKDRKPLAVTRIKLASGDGTFCKVGFPFHSIEKFAPERANFNGEDSNHVTFDVMLPPQADGQERTFETMAATIDKWTETFEIKPPKDENNQQTDTAGAKKPASKKPDKTPTSQLPIFMQHQQPPAATATGAGLIQQILTYPLSERTPMENIQFIQTLKQRVASIL